MKMVCCDHQRFNKIVKIKKDILARLLFKNYVVTRQCDCGRIKRTVAEPIKRL